MKKLRSGDFYSILVKKLQEARKSAKAHNHKYRKLGIQMEITLEKTGLEDIELLYHIQLCSFMPLYEKYHDDDTSPAKESLEQLAARMSQPESRHFLILAQGKAAGSIRIKILGQGRYHLSQIGVLPELQGQGIAQKALTILESVFADARVWELETIMQEKRNCHLYEKLGFRQTGECRVINDNMTIVGYEKRIAP